MAEPGSATSSWRRTPLYDAHRALGARLVEFGGWEMPVQYTGILEEHRAVRQRAGLFDVCHMGEFTVEGAGAVVYLQSLVPNDVSRLVDDQALYTQICRPDGGTLDDLLIYRRAAARYLVVVNAGTMPNDWRWFSEHAAKSTDITLRNISDETGLLALQGPRAQDILQPLTATPLDEIAYYHCRDGVVTGIPCLISRTGYTGEDGFELYCASDAVATLWDALLQAGAPAGLLPAGLGARDTLRLEAGYCLYGHELSESITPLEAGLAWTVKLGKGCDFIGQEALAAQKRDGLPKRLVGLVPQGRGIPRAGYPILRDGVPIGMVTSGTHCPTLDGPAALGFVPPADAKPGTLLAVEIRGSAVPALVTALPFYQREKR